MVGGGGRGGGVWLVRCEYCGLVSVCVVFSVVVRRSKMRR